MRFLCCVCGKEFDNSTRRKQHESDTHNVERGKRNKGVSKAFARAVIAPDREKNRA